VHPVGRLDFNTEGLLILTNDGDLTNYVTAARNKVAKVYEVKVKGVPPEVSIERLRRGIILDDGVKTKPAEVELSEQSESNAWFRVILHEGRNQQIRKMFDAIGHSVVKLRRVQIGPIKDERLPAAHWRMLAPAEVAQLMGAKRRERPAKPRPRPKAGAKAGAKARPKAKANSGGHA
jgi:23S rRNA pseudouridine2605 synthase